MDSTTSVLEDKAQIGIATANDISTARAAGKPVVAVAAIHSPDEAGLMTRHYKENADASFESAFLVALIPLIQNGDVPIGWMDRGKWHAMAEDLVSVGLPPKAFDPTDACTMKPLKAIHPEDKVQ